MTLRPCIVPRCSSYAVDGYSYCVEHARQRASFGLTGERTVPGYWQSLRRRILRQQRGRCAIYGCQSSATRLHHIDGNPANDQRANLIALCDTHHLNAHGRSPRA